VSLEFLWYIPNTVQAGHRGDDVAGGWANLGRSAELAQIVEEHGARVGDQLLSRLRGAVTA
jgi:alkanesulfonate monooxygenase